MVEMISQLTDIEDNLLAQVDSVTGLIEDKTAKLRDVGVFAGYAQLHRRYVELIDDPSYGIEALKRALFIQWFAVSEPACFTGILEVDPEAEVKVFARLDAMANDSAFDNELQFMLAWYYEVTGFYFQRRNNIPNLSKFFEKRSHDLTRIRKSDFQGRGQMGRYWQSLNI